MATGGWVAMYPLGDNVGAVTGEGYALAFDAGAEMIGIEFGHFLPTPIFPRNAGEVRFRGFVNGLLNESDARLHNGAGERFMFRYFPDRGEKRHCPRTLIRCICAGNRRGTRRAHGGIYSTCRCADEFRGNERYRRMYELADRAGMDLQARADRTGHLSA